jgi:hypothetical protein
MNKRLIVILSVIVVIVLLGSAFSYVLYNGPRNKTFPISGNNPNLKIIKFTSSLDPTEAYTTPIKLPNSSTSQSYYPYPVFNMTLYSSSSANTELLVNTLNGTTLDLMGNHSLDW